MTLQIDLAQIAPKRRSVSQFSTYMSCGEQYRLSRVAQAPQRPAAWFAMGSAVHEVIEQWELWDRQGTVDQAKHMYVQVYDRMIDEETARAGHDAEWLTGSKKPGSQDIEERRERGQGHVERYIEWALANSQQWQVAMIDGKPAVEVEFSLMFGGVEVKGFIDQVIEDVSGVIYPRDLKSGTKRPETPFQLAVYSQALEELYGIESRSGSFAMTKESGDKIEHFEPLQAWSRPILDEMFESFNIMELAGLYVPNPGGHCRTCPVLDFCRIKGDPEKVALYAQKGGEPMGV